MRGHTVRLAAVVSLAAALAVPSRAEDPTCSQIQALVEQGMPAGVGDPALIGPLLRPQVGPQFVDRFPTLVYSSALPAVGSGLQPKLSDCKKDSHGRPIDCRVDNEQLAEFLRFDSTNGKLAYLNRNREYASGNNTISQQEALTIVDGVMAAFGVPSVELGRPDVQDLMIAAGSPAGGPVDLIRRTEVHARRERSVGGTPVFDSGLWASVSSSGQIARMRIQWPRFQLIPGLASTQTISRAQVIQTAARELSQGALCQSYGRVDSIIAYVPAAQTLASDRNDDAGPSGPVGEGFVPALVVYAAPVEVPEDSGQVAMAGRQIIVPLLDTAGDARAQEGHATAETDEAQTRRK